MKDYRCPKCKFTTNKAVFMAERECLVCGESFSASQELAIAAERTRTIEEMLELVKVMPAMTMTNPANNHPANAYKLIDKNDVLAKLEAMRGER